MPAKKGSNRQPDTPKQKGLDAKAEKSKEAKEEKKDEKKEHKRSKMFSYLIVALLIIIIAIGVYFVLTNYVSTPFSTFKSNFIAAPRVAFVVGFSTVEGFINESLCFPTMLQYIAHTRNASTIDFFIVNQSNSTCVYQVGGLGHINIATQPAGNCLSVARTEPSIFLNYSAENKTMINLYHLYVQGNYHYMISCPIGAELG